MIFTSPLVDNARLLALLTCLLAPLMLQSADAASVEEWRKRSIYQVMTDRFAMSGQGGSHTIEQCTHDGMYCGGTWEGLIEHLDYIQGMNFNAVWISPVVRNLPQHTVDGEGYAGYWSQDLYSLNENFGYEHDLLRLVDALHSRDMLFMMDVVPNHMAYNGNATGEIDYEVFNPFNKAKYFHPFCPMDYSGENATALQECWLGSDEVPLVDLKTEDEEVAEMFGEWIEWMVETYKVDGLRIDAGVNVAPEFLSQFVERAGVFSTAEVYIEDVGIACDYQEAMGSVLNYPLYWPMTEAFQNGGSMADLKSMMDQQAEECPDVTSLTTFSENQDVPRFGNHTEDMAHAKNVVAFVLMFDGIPVIYQGIEQHFLGGTEPFTNREPIWLNEHNVFTPLYRYIAVLNTLRLHMARTNDNYINTQTEVISTSSEVIVMSKGQGSASVLSILNNLEEDSGSESITVSSSPFSSGTELTEVLSCDTLTVDSNDGSFTTSTTDGEPLVYIPTELLEDSSLCGHGGQKFVYEHMEDTISTRVMSTTVGGQLAVSTAAVTMPVVTTPAESTAAEGAAPIPYAASSWSVIGASLVAVVLSNGLLGAGVVFARRT